MIPIPSSFSSIVTLLWVATVVRAADPTVVFPPATEVHSLARCVEASLAGNPSLRAERESRNELSGQKWQALSTGLPTIRFKANWSLSRDPSFALDETFAGGDFGSVLDSLFGDVSFIPSPGDIEAQSFWRTHVNADWELNPFRVANAVGAANLAMERQEQLIAWAEIRVIEAALMAFHDVLAASAALEASEAELASRLELLGKERDRLALDRATPLDTLRAAVSAANFRPERRRREQAVRAAGAHLNLLMGREFNAPLALESAGSPEWDEVPLDALLDRLPQRPDLVAEQLWISMQEKDRGVRRSDYRPFLEFGGSYGRVGRTFASLGADGQDQWSASVGLAVPLFDGFYSLGRVREISAKIARSEFAREDHLRTARHEAGRALADLGIARQDLNAADLVLAAATEAFRVTEERYLNERVEYPALAHARAELHVARTNLIAARRDLLVRIARVKRVAGLSPMAPLSRLSPPS